MIPFMDNFEPQVKRDLIDHDGRDCGVVYDIDGERGTV